MELLHGMLVKLALKRTAGDSDYHTALARIRIDGDKATCRCVVCGCHRLSLSPEIILLTRCSYRLPRHKE
jgi:hypothetical protein